MQQWADAVDGRRGRRAEVAGRWNAGIEVRCVDDVLRFGDTVLPFRGGDVGGGEAGVEESSAAAEDDTRWLVFWPERPGEGETRSSIRVIVNAGLRFEAHAIAQRHAGARLPVIFEKDGEILHEDVDVGIASDDAELRSTAAAGANLRGSLTAGETLLRDLVAGDRGKDELAVEASGGAVRVPRGAITATQGGEVMASGERDVVLQFVTVLVVALVAGVIAATGECALHIDGGGRVR